MKPTYIGNLAPKIFLILLGLIVLATVSPALQPIPHRDSGVFLYIGRGILNGKLPYLDFWDHKGPLIYYINALGLSLYGNSYWGIWFVEICSLITASLISFSLMEDRFNKKIAFIGTALWLLALGRTFTAQFGAGNHVEEYAILLYLAQMYFFLQKRRSALTYWKFFFIGIFAGLSILLRPNLAAPLFSVYLVIIWSLFGSEKDDKIKALKNLAQLTSGTLLIVACAAFYFWYKHAIQDLFYDAIVYNFFYAGSGTQYTSAFIFSFDILGAINIIALISWFALILFPQKMTRITGDQTLVRFLIILLPSEIALSLMSGYGYIHYFISWLPILGLLSCIFMLAITQYFLKKIKGNLYAWAALFFILILQAIPFGKDLQLYYQVALDNIKSGGIFLTDEKRSPEWDGIRQLYKIAPKNTEVIFWGNEVQYNFIMDLPSPSKYIYLYPFMRHGYATSEMQNSLLNSIKTRKPVIVDIQPSSMPPIKAPSRWKIYPETMPFIFYIKNNYVILREINVTSYYYVNNQKWKINQKWIVWVHK